MKIYLVLSVFFSSPILLAQSLWISGSLRTSEGEALPGATIKAMLISDSTQWHGAVSDQNGNFNLAIFQKDRYRVQISYLGFETKVQEVEVQGEENLGNIGLKGLTQTL